MLKIVHIFFLLTAMLCPAPGFAGEEEAAPVWLIRDGNIPDAEPPLNFRLPQDDFSRRSETGILPTNLGLFSLRVSGSGQFSEKGLIWIKEELKKYKLVIIDLRQESHGFLNGIAVSWYTQGNQINKGKSLKEIEEDEASRLAGLLSHRSATVYKLSALEPGQEFRPGVDPELIKINDAVTEKELCADLGIYYVRLPVADYQQPSDEDVDRFIVLVRSMGPDSWLHIHCREGDGRTTTFLAMFDMMHNARRVGMGDIIKRQWLLGGADISSLNFIRHFYQYCQNSEEGFPQLWSEWLKQMGKDASIP